MFIIIRCTFWQRIFPALIRDSGLHQRTRHIITVFIAQIEGTAGLKLQIKLDYRDLTEGQESTVIPILLKCS